MPITSGLFDDHEHAAAAIARLQAAGIGGTAISVIAHYGGEELPAVREQTDGSGSGDGLGPLVGGIGGLLAGLGIIAVPGLGPVLAGGWLLATAAGALAGTVTAGATGGIVGALVAAGIPETNAHVYAESIRRGATLVSAHVDDADEPGAREALSPNSIDVGQRRATYEEEGWSGFSEPTDIYDIEGARARHEPILPPFI